MSGFLLHTGATVQCAHAGAAQPAGGGGARVKAAGQGVVTQPTTYNVSPDCAAPRPNAGNGPCVSARWTTGARRVKAEGQAVLLGDSSATCTPTGTGLRVLATQQRVKGA
ncbi:hypothetical protein [Streptomyces sp. NPDC002758]